MLQAKTLMENLQAVTLIEKLFFCKGITTLI